MSTRKIIIRITEADPVMGIRANLKTGELLITYEDYHEICLSLGRVERIEITTLGVCVTLKE